MAKNRINSAIKTRLLVIGKWKEVYAEQRRRIKNGVRNSGFVDVLLDVAPSVAKEFGVESYDDAYKCFEGGSCVPTMKYDGAGRPSAEEEEKACEDAGISVSDLKARRDSDVRKIAGRTCSYVDAVEWAFVRSTFGEGAKTKDAPSEMAWALYMQFRESKNFMWDIAKSAITAKMKKEEVEETHSGGFDGDAEYNILDELGRKGGQQ